MYHLPHRVAVEDDGFLESVCSPVAGPMMSGNKIGLLFSGDAAIDAVFEEIRNATHSIHLEVFMVISGKVADELQELMIEKARQGLEVRLLMDAIGSFMLRRKYVAAMRKGGVAVDCYHARRVWGPGSSLNRSHRRNVVIDGRIAYTGGLGLGDDWREWRETMVRVEGPAVSAFQTAFQEHWGEVCQEILTGHRLFPDQEKRGGVLAKCVASSGLTDWSRIKTVYAVAISSAVRSLSISSAYFVPDPDAIALLCDAAARGVDVRVITPGEINDMQLTKTAAKADFGRLIRAGVRIYEYIPTMYHPKSMVADGLFCIVGSSNIDARSFHRNQELDLMIHDRGVARQLEEAFERDLANSALYTYQEWKNRGIRQRIKEVLLHPLKPQL
jgi:cardiolipin synthase A/B